MADEAATLKRFLDPKAINKIKNLELRARRIMEGFLIGMHKSPYKGFSIEFAQHREYVPGDDLRHLDWKVYGRQDRLYLKEYELETNLRSHIFLDTSESMEYQSDEGISKLEMACYIAASIAYLAINQFDACSLVCFDKGTKSILPARTGMGHLRSILNLLGAAAPENKTDIGTTFSELAERIKHRGLVVVISDLFDKPENILEALQHLRFKRHDIIIFHVMDKDEVTFPFDRMTLFEGLEEYPHILTEPRSVRKAYLEELNKFVTTLRQGCTGMHVDYEQVTTDKALDVALSKYLATRMARRMREFRK